ncbi:MAG: hypothetical protein WD733_18650, partial [Bryobacterales bacterium]
RPKRPQTFVHLIRGHYTSHAGHPMTGKRTAVAVTAGTGIGILIGKLTPGSAANLLSQIVDRVFAFLAAQGGYASFAIVMTVGFGWLSVWCIRLLVDGKQSEIDRVAEERDKFAQLFIDDWQSSKTDGLKGAKRK